MLSNSSDQILPSIGFADDRKVLTVGEIATRWRVTDRHVIDLIEEGKLTAFDIAGRHEYMRVPVKAIGEIANRLNVPTEDVIKIVQNFKPKLLSSKRAFYRVPIVEGYNAFLKENHSLNLG